MNAAVFLLRAKQIGFTMEELDQMDEGQIMDIIIESNNDQYADEYAQVADQHDFDAF